MDSRRAVKREARLKAELLEYRKSRPKISEQFSDLKRGLSELDEDTWGSIPDAMDYSRRNKLQNNRREKFTPLPDSVIQGARIDTNHGNVLQQQAAAEQKFSGLETPLGIATPLAGPTDLTQLGRARDKVLSLKLDRMADSVAGQTVVDPKGYLTDLNSVKVNNEAQISNIKKARQLLKSVITTNRKHAPGWIAAARLEYETGKIAAARTIIMKGCEECPQSQDVWLEAALMHTKKTGKAILAKAVQHLPSSIKLWIRAADMENDIDSKKAVLRRALELIPNSVKLWKAAIEMEDPEDARILLGRAVECVPQSVDMWLAYARLESYKNAQMVLNRARRVIPTEKSIWITAAKLEEAEGNSNNVDTIISKAVASLAAHQVIIDRDNWLEDAELCEQSGAVLTCQAIVRACLGIGVEDQDRRATWINDADHFVSRGSIEVSRAIYAHMLTVYPSKKSVWLRAAELERSHGTRETLDQLLKKSVQYCPQAEILWLMAAKEKWLAGDVKGAREVLSAAFVANPDSEEVWLAAVKLENESNEYERARVLLAEARDRAVTARVWMKSAKIERQLGDRSREYDLLQQGLVKFPKYPKLYIMLSQFFMKDDSNNKKQKMDVSSSSSNTTNNKNNYSNGNGAKHSYEPYSTISGLNEKELQKRARDTFRRAIRQCPQDVSIWLCYSNFELSVNATVSRARSILETARLRVPRNEELWLASIRVERKASNFKVAGQLMAKGLQECPSSGLLWAYAIATDSRPTRKARSYEALKRCTDDPRVFAAVAKLFWLDRKLAKARNWFNRAVTVDSDIGDIWAYYYKFELEHGTADKQENICKRVKESDPRHGELWTSVSKLDKNIGATPVHILKKVAGKITDIFPANPDDLSGGGKKKRKRKL